MLKKIYRAKYFKFLVALLYSLLYFYGYKTFLNPYYGYAGFGLIKSRLDDSEYFLTSIALATLPALLYRGIRQISSFLTIFIYFVLYIPITITFFLSHEGNIGYLLFLQGCFFFGICLLFLSDRFPVGRVFVLPGQLDPFKIVLVLTWIGTLYIGFVYRGSLHFASYEDVYLQRSANEALGRDVFTAYFGAWLANVFIPISASYGLFAKKKIYFVSALVGSLIFYMATADKAILLFPFIIYGIYKFLNNKDLRNAFSAIGLGIIALMVLTLAFGLNIVSALFWMRTIGNGGLLTKLYQEYFMAHPTTYLSHINIVNAFTQSYPYPGKSLGQVVGSEYFSDATNANANFWATDGIASFGDSGIIIASLFLFFTFIWFNKITSRYNKVFIICTLVPFVSSLLNQSLFSSLLTGGGFWIMFILSFKSALHNKFINENLNNTRRKAAVH